MKYIAAIVLLSQVFVTACPNQPSSSASLDFTGDAAIEEWHTDMIFVPLNNPYPADWPAELKLPPDVLLNRKGKIVNFFGSDLIAEGVLEGSAKDVFDKIRASFSSNVQESSEMRITPSGTGSSYSQTFHGVKKTHILKITTIQSTKKPKMAFFSVILTQAQ